MLVFRDITERRSLEHELAERHDAATDAKLVDQAIKEIVRR